ncbi:MAG TPA: helical backbone metal receptor [Panacibacter sp.]|nr:helical backbone metal receptor [Panacibacter sp.]
MFQCKDQMGNIIKLGTYPPKRIISLVPSQTELLHYLGLDEEVIGITKFCVHPQTLFRNKARVGGTKNVNIEKIKSLMPDLIIANKEENVKEQIEELHQIAPVWVSDVNNFEDALNMIKSIGELVVKEKQAEKLIAAIETAFSKLQTTNYKLQTAYLIWRNPHMTIGGDTFINDMLCKCGLQNIFENEKRYPAITLETIKERDTKLILLSSEPFPFKEKHAEEIKNYFANSQSPIPKILIVDGEMFSWYGSRMLFAAQYFSELINHIYLPDSDYSNLA